MLGEQSPPDPSRFGEGVGPLGMELGGPVHHDARGALGSLPHEGRLGGRDQARRVRLVRDRFLRGLRAVLVLVAGPRAERAQPCHFGCPRRGRCGPLGRRCRLI